MTTPKGRNPESPFARQRHRLSESLSRTIRILVRQRLGDSVTRSYYRRRLTYLWYVFSAPAGKGRTLGAMTPPNVHVHAPPAGRLSTSFIHPYSTIVCGGDSKICAVSVFTVFIVGQYVSLFRLADTHVYYAHGNGHKRLDARLISPVVVLTVAALVTPSSPGCSSDILPSTHRKHGRLLSLTRTTVPISIVGPSFVYLLRFWSSFKYS